MDKSVTGKAGEELAAKFLKKNGYGILKRNYRSVFGEIDIIAEKDGFLVFVEVKTRLSLRYGAPKTAVTEHKKKQISKTAQEFINRNRLQNHMARFDVVSIEMDKGIPRIELITNAFEAAP